MYVFTHNTLISFSRKGLDPVVPYQKGSFLASNFTLCYPVIFFYLQTPKGLASGMCIAGFGGGALLFGAPLCGPCNVFNICNVRNVCNVYHVYDVCDVCNVCM